MDYDQDCWGREEGVTVDICKKVREPGFFADDIAILAQRRTDMQGKTDDATASAG